MEDLTHEHGIAGLLVAFAVLVFDKVFLFLKNQNQDVAHSQAIKSLAESVRTQVSVLERSVETLNQILSEIRREQVDQKATLARLEERMK